MNRSKPVDALMRKVASCMVSDFQRNLNDTDFCRSFQTEIRKGNIVRAREVAPAPTPSMNVAEYKATYQMESLLKRYRFHKDTYSDSELTDMAINGYLTTQSRLASLDLDSLPAKAQVILDLAANYIAELLGVYNDEECRDLCRFGSGASKGVPARMATEAARWESPMTGSLDQIAWFDSEMSQIDSVVSYRQAQKKSESRNTDSLYQVVESLTLSLVPKSFKSLRAIMPNTTIGSYMSSGLGSIMRKRLKGDGHDIAKLQMRHRYLAQAASMHQLHVTADLSSASDSISVALVARLFPPDWVEILTKSRIGRVELPNGVVVESNTFCTMGIGYTFPLQTLVFLALLKSIQAVNYSRFDKRTISVYGDDLIYASRMHKEVVLYFNLFGFVINEDKTFFEGGFRESCGGDYYHGIDVRPFQPRSGQADVRDTAYEAILYKLVNTLLTRWSEYEVEETLAFLTSEIQSHVGKVKIVPCDFPDDSGVKVSSLTKWDFAFLLRSQCAQLKAVGHGVYRFPYLRSESERREEVRHEPYLWLGLRGGNSDVDYPHSHSYQRIPSPLAAFIEAVIGYRDDCRVLRTAPCKPTKMVRSSTGRRLRRTFTFVTISHTGKYKRQFGSSCFEDRRPTNPL
jgi:hypothetical protein